jgi:DNA-binding MarR family transcriptional regulator
MGTMEHTSFDRLLLDVFREMGAHRPEQLLPGWSLSLSEIYALGILAERAPLSQQDLGDALALEKSSVSRLVQQLERHGWVSRERDAHDGRLRLLRLTEPGAAVAAQIDAHMSARHAELFAQLMPADQTALLQGLTALRRALYRMPWRTQPAEEASTSHPRGSTPEGAAR